MSEPTTLPVPPFPHTPPSEKTPYWCTECIDYSEHTTDYHKKTVRWKGATKEGRRLLMIQNDRKKYRKHAWVKEITKDPAFYEVMLYGVRAAVGVLRIFT